MPLNRIPGQAFQALLILTFALGNFVLALSAGAEQPGKVPRVGLLCAVKCVVGSFVVESEGQAFLKGLRDAGYVDGQNVFIEQRAAGVPYGELDARAVELVRLKVDVIVAMEGLAAARAAKDATGRIPIVMVGVPDAVQFGLVRSTARPGGNITGLSLPFVELVNKQVELLKEVVPGLSRIAVVWNPQSPEHAPTLPGVEIAARGLGLQLRPFDIRGPADFDDTFSAIRKWGATALIVLNDPSLSGGALTLLAVKSRLPTIALQRVFVAGGGLMSYGPNRLDMYQRAAAYVGKILKGAKPADLPIEEPTRFELVVNLGTAKALGLTIPQSVLLRADDVIR